MSDEPAAKHAKFDVKETDVKKYVECPICFGIPRDGSVLQCQNGHIICARCKGQIDNAKCPQGQCDYHDPPTRNRVVEAIIRDLPFSRPCKHESSHCQFEGTMLELEAHEVDCEHRPVPCPIDVCDELVSFDNVVEHCQTAHSTEVKECSSSFSKVYAWKQCWVGCGRSSCWIEDVRVTSEGKMFSCTHYEGGLIYVFLIVLAGSAEAGKIKCRITLENDDNSISFTTPVYPIDWTSEKIMKDPRCFRVSEWNINQMLDNDIPEDWKEEGYDGKFDVAFSIDNNTA